MQRIEYNQFPVLYVFQGSLIYIWSNLTYALNNLISNSNFILTNDCCFWHEFYAYYTCLFFPADDSVL